MGHSSFETVLPPCLIPHSNTKFMMKTIPGTFLATPERGEVSSLLLCPAEADHLLLLAHGAGAGMTHPNMVGIAEALAKVGVGTFRYQFSYLEQGKGRESATVSIATVRSAVAAAQQAVPDLPLLAGGHSYGGRMTSLAAAQFPLPGVKGLIFFNFPLHAPGNPKVERAAHLPQIEPPMLFLSGSRDTFAQAELLTQALEPIQERATLHWLDTANHSYQVLKRKRAREDDVFTEIAGAVREWLVVVRNWEFGIRDS